MPSKFQVHILLKDRPAELAALEEFARDPARTVDDCWEWMQAKGYTLARSAVGTWKKKFDRLDAFAASNDAARSLVDAAKSGGVISLTEATELQLSQMLFEQLAVLQSNGEVQTKELVNVSAAMKNVVTSKRHLEKLKTEISAALNEAEKDAKAGGSAENVVNKVREILGIGA